MAFWMHFFTYLSTPDGTPLACGGMLSFTSTTKVATSQGAKVIGTLRLGDKVWAYNPTTHTMELKPVVHIWINRDHDLVDITIASTTSSHHGTSAHKTTEVVHTNQKHPFLTMEQGFVPVSHLHVGMHVVNADGGTGTIIRLNVVPGTMTMYNLEVAQDHTFTVGDGKWIVHNCGGVNDDTFDNRFEGLDGASYQQLLARVPQSATARLLYKGSQVWGIEWKWSDNGYTYRLRIHEADENAAQQYADSNAANGPVWRLSRSGGDVGEYYYNAQDGLWYHQSNLRQYYRSGSLNPNYDEDAANGTHNPADSFDPFAPEPPPVDPIP